MLSHPRRLRTAVPARRRPGRKRDRPQDRHDGTPIVSGAGELAHALTNQSLVDEFWFWVSPYLWPTGPRIFDGARTLRLELIGATTFRSGMLRLAYRPAPDPQDVAAS
jgi:dihydrofolate reductase